MRKILFIIASLFVLLPSLVFAEEPISDDYLAYFGGAVAGGGVKASVVCDDCLGTLWFAWHMENVDIETGDPCGCSDDADKEFSLSGSNIEFSTEQKYDGTYSLKSTATAGVYVITISGMDPDEIKITFNLWVTSYPASEAKVLYLLADTSNFIDIRIFTGGSIGARHRGGGGSSYSVTTATSLPTGEWMSCEYQVSVAANGGNNHYIGCGAVTQTDADTLDASSDHTSMQIGNGAGASATYYIDNIAIGPQDKF